MITESGPGGESPPQYHSESGGSGPASPDLIAAARRGLADRVRNLIEEGAEVNGHEWGTGLTALHYAAAYDAVEVLRVLVASGRCDFTLRDNRGRTPATLAFMIADNPAVGRLLLKKEYEQLRRRGENPAPPAGPKPSA